VRELRNVVERLILLADEGVDEEMVRDVLAKPGMAGGRQPPAGVVAAPIGSLAERVAAFERDTIARELAVHAFRMTETARALGLERSHLYKKCQQLGIDLKAERGER
jgi:DNA-binding NtrC family response regulator